MNYYTTKELCKILKVTRQTINEWRKLGMPFVKFGKLVRFNYEEVEKWLLKK